MASFGSQPLPLKGGGSGFLLLQNQPSHGGRPAAVFCRENGAGARRGDFRLRFPARGGMSEVLVGLEKGRGLQATGKGGIFDREKRVEDGEGDGAAGDVDAAVQATVDKEKKKVQATQCSRT